MRKWYALFAASILMISCNNSRPLKNCETYEEAPNPDKTEVDWSGVTGFHSSFGSIDTKYVKNAIPQVTPSNEWQGTGWRGERLSAQLILWSDKDVKQIECEFSAFKSNSGDVINANQAEARFVRYVLTDEFAEGCGYRKPEDFAVSLSADALDNVECLDMKAKTAQPIWLTFQVPADAAPGVYNGTITLYAQGEKTKNMKLTLEVLPEVLPPARDWTFHLDLWQHPSAVARINNVPHWSDEHWQLLETPMKMLADAGQKVITATLNKDPWNHQCFDAYEDMIVWTKKADGTWHYDYSIFDKWINMMMRLGVDKVINCYSMIPWNNEIHYNDEKSGELINISAKPGSKEFISLWTPFLQSFREHLTEKGWLEITNIAMDERSPEDMKATIDLLTKIVPEFGISLADNHKSYKEYPMLKDICISYGSGFEDEDLNFRKENGLISTYYVCCAHEFPGLFTFSDPADAAFVGWYTRAKKLDGFLHWSYNSWVENPLTDSRFLSWPAGDTYLIYPNGRSSIRFERLIEGIQDAEKIRILQEKFALSGDTENLMKLENELTKFRLDEKPDTPSAQILAHGKQVLNELSK